MYFTLSRFHAYKHKTKINLKFEEIKSILLAEGYESDFAVSKCVGRAAQTFRNV